MIIVNPLHANPLCHPTIPIEKKKKALSKHIYPESVEPNMHKKTNPACIKNPSSRLNIILYLCSLVLSNEKIHTEKNQHHKFYI